MVPEDKRNAPEQMYPGKGIEAPKLLDNALGTEPAEEGVKEWVGPTPKAQNIHLRLLDGCGVTNGL